METWVLSQTWGTAFCSPTPTLDAPQGCIPKAVRTSFSFPGQIPGICCLALGNPLVLVFGFFPGMPVLLRRFWRLRDLGLCLWGGDWAQGAATIVSVRPCVQRGFWPTGGLCCPPFDLTCHLSCLPAGPHILPSNNACNNSMGLELHKVGLVLKAVAGESLAHAPNGCAINRAYQRSTCVSV